MPQVLYQLRKNCSLDENVLSPITRARYS